MTLLAREMSAIMWEFEHSLAPPFFGIGMKTGFFQSLSSVPLPDPQVGKSVVALELSH